MIQVGSILRICNSKKKKIKEMKKKTEEGKERRNVIVSYRCQIKTQAIFQFMFRTSNFISENVLSWRKRLFKRNSCDKIYISWLIKQERLPLRWAVDILAEQIFVWNVCPKRMSYKIVANWLCTVCPSASVSVCNSHICTHTFFQRCDERSFNSLSNLRSGSLVCVCVLGEVRTS